MSHQPLKGLTVLEFSQYLSGPSAGLRLADMGARVIKIERPGTGDACRQLAIKNLWADESSLLFHTINRNKESFAADLKNPEDIIIIKKLIARADVITHNFRPGIMEKCGLGYEDAKIINPKIIYATISGYGSEGPWKTKPGQDLLLQSLSGLAYTTGNADEGPVPFGIAVADIFCGAQMVQGILAALIRRQKKGVGALVELSLLESLLDFQFELFTTYFASGKKPLRSNMSNGQPLLGAPYGMYKTSTGFIAIAMVKFAALAKAIDSVELSRYSQAEAFEKRDEIKDILAKHLLHHSSAYWITRLHDEDLWAMEVLDWTAMKRHEGYRSLDMEQQLDNNFITTRCPIRINGEILKNSSPAPGLGADNLSILNELPA